MARKGLKTGRKTQHRTRGKRFLIACGGNVTEPEYFSALKTALGKQNRIEINNRLASKDPTALLKKLGREVAAENKRAKNGGYEGYESVWAVVDADEFDLHKAQKEADSSGIQLIISNPCFEVWLIDHFHVCPDSCSTTKTAEEHARSIGVTKSTNNHKRSNLERYKSVALDLVPDQLETALKNARRHNTGSKQQVRNNNPGSTSKYAVWTDVPVMIEKLRNASQDGDTSSSER